MAKTEWGLKRACQSCNTRFYDLGRDPITCPKCGAHFDPEALLKTKRVKAAPVERPPVPAEVEETEVAEDEGALVEGEAAEEEEEAVIEDTSELGEDTDDMAEVIENVDDEEER